MDVPSSRIHNEGVRSNGRFPSAKGDVVVRERRRDDVMFALTVWGSSGAMTSVRFLVDADRCVW
jgi:hypothetical protein